MMRRSTVRIDDDIPVLGLVQTSGQRWLVVGKVLLGCQNLDPSAETVCKEANCTGKNVASDVKIGSEFFAS